MRIGHPTCGDAVVNQENRNGGTIKVTGELCPKWADIPGFPGYQASSDGQIKNRRGRILKQRRSKRGNVLVDIGKSTATVASLVLRAFTGYPSFWERGAYHAKNADGDRGNNRIENLVWEYKWGRWS